MGVRLTDTDRRLIALVEDVTGVAPRDCFRDDHGQVWFVVAPDAVADVIGRDGTQVERIEERIDRAVRVVAWADDPAAFVANALAPAAVYNVTIVERAPGDSGATADGTSDNAERVAVVEVDPDDRGVAIGVDGRTIEPARELVRRHYDVDDIELA
jgi:N utilization substance protein A